ncbi:MAG: biopolymer transporter ExbD [Gammaproteobacteria bacterium]|nr:biopolymer transporter ExbD [Gammaproteobacteria bacterium]
MSDDDLCPMPKLNLGQPEISMAPLVDVVFLLLIFFMVTTVFPDNEGVVIEKPRSENSAALPERPFRIQLDQAGQAYLKKQPVSLLDLTRLIAIESKIKADLSVMLQVDRRATAEMLMAVVDAAKAGGAQSLAIATDDKSQ